MKAHASTLPALLAALCLVVSATALAQEDDQTAAAVEDQLSGTYELALSDAEVRDRIDGAIEEVVSDMSFLKRPFARKRLKETTRPCNTIRISFPDDQISIQCDDRPPAVSPDGQERVRYKADDGSVYRLSQDRSGRSLQQTFVADEGSRTNLLVLEGDDETLEMTAELQSEQLPRPIIYRLSYEKK